MQILSAPPCDCNGQTDPPSKSCCSPDVVNISPDGCGQNVDEPCCGKPTGPPSSPFERPGYLLCDHVSAFLNTPAGMVPQIRTDLNKKDVLGNGLVRLGVNRNEYKVAPGLYAVGTPDADAPVLVSCNYKLTFDHLRSHLTGVDGWLLILDTRGINVWCAAGKGTFGTDELIRQVQNTQLDKVVSHRKLVVPQLGATGVAAARVKKACGFEVLWGPVRAEDVRAFLQNPKKVDPRLRQVTFTFAERLVLIPVEITLLGKTLAWTLLAIFLLSGIGASVFSFSMAWQRGGLAVAACLAGVVAGTALVPALLPMLPGRAFAVKGVITGLAAVAIVLLFLSSHPYLNFWSLLALILFAVAVSSFTAMNFTGSTPYTSPSGVEKEMRTAIPLQLAAVVLAAGIWIGNGFTDYLR